MVTPRPREVSTLIYAVGAVFLVYGAGLGILSGLFGLIALQGADEETAILPHLALLLVALAVPAVLVLVGRGVMQGRSAAYRAGLLLPVLIVPLATWSLFKTEARAATPFAQAAELLGIEAVFASGSVLLSITLFFGRWRSKGQ